MKALVYVGEEKLDFREVADPVVNSSEQLIKVDSAGICGSDLSTVDGHASRYFEPFVSFPFVPGHEVVGDTDDGRRVVLDPVLGHAARGFEPPFEGAQPGDGDDYRHLTTGDLTPGIQTGFCETTGGAWSTEFVAHPSQLHEVPEWMSDELAVLMEPVAGGVHAALRAKIANGDTVADKRMLAAWEFSTPSMYSLESRHSR